MSTQALRRACEADTLCRGPRGPVAGFSAGCDTGSAADPRLIRHHACPTWPAGISRRTATTIRFPAGLAQDTTRCPTDSGRPCIVGRQRQRFYEAFCRAFGRSSPSRRQIRWSSQLTGVAKKRSAADHHRQRAVITARRPGATGPGWPTTDNGSMCFLACAIVRLCLSCVSMPPGYDVAADLARLITPFGASRCDQLSP